MRYDYLGIKNLKGGEIFVPKLPSYDYQIL